METFKKVLFGVLGFFRRLSAYVWKKICGFFRWINKAMLVFLWATIVSIIVIGGSLFYYCYLDLYFNPEKAPDIKPFIEFVPPTSGLIYDNNNGVIIELAKESQYRKIVSYKQIPPVIIQAILSAEDERFFSWHHRGIDFFSIFRATISNLGYTIGKSAEKSRLVIVRDQGASTITQQTVRLWFLLKITQVERSDRLIVENFITTTFSNFVDVPTVNSFTRKLIEMRNAFWLERQMTNIYGSRQEAKEQILTRFANYTYFGGGRYGVEAACEYYFGSTCQNLETADADKAALLAGMIKSPSLFSPRPNQSEESRKRQIYRRNLIISLMGDNGYLSNRDAALMAAKPLELVFRHDKTIAPSVVSDALKEVRDYGFSNDDVYGGYVRVNLTVNLKIQEITNRACENGLAEYEKRHPEHQGLVQCSVVVLRNSDAEILAEVGGRKWYQGREYKYSDLNRVNRQRPVGSVFKAFDYFTAFTLGKTPDDIIVDSPFSISKGFGRGSHQIHNYDGKYIGAAPLKDMLKGSRNIPAVKLVLSLGDGKESGMEKVEKVIKILGINSPLHSDTDLNNLRNNKRMVYITSALGASEMNVLEIANGYRSLATGLSAEPHMVREIKDRDGKTLFSNKYLNKPLPFDQKAFDMIQYCLRRVVTQPGGTAYSLTIQKFPIPIAGKTGTTDDFRNAWFAGFTYGLSGITIVARVDFDDNQSLASRETGSVAAMPIVKEIFLKVYGQNLVGPVSQFPAHLEDKNFGVK